MSSNETTRQNPILYQDESDIALAQSPGDSESKPKNRGGKGRRKIDIKYIDDKTRRQITFSKRKAGLMKKAYELSTLTGTQILVLVTSETGHVYTFATRKFQPFITDKKGKNLIQQCLSASDIDGAEAPEYEENEDEEREGSDGVKNEPIQMQQQVMSGEMNMAGHQFNPDYQRFNGMSMMTDMNPRMVISRFHTPQQQALPDGLVMRQDAQWRHMPPSSH